MRGSKRGQFTAHRPVNESVLGRKAAPLKAWTIWPATCGSGAATGTAPTRSSRTLWDLPGEIGVRYVAGRSTARRYPCAPHIVAGIFQRSGTATLGFG